MDVRILSFLAVQWTNNMEGLGYFSLFDCRADRWAIRRCEGNVLVLCTFNP